MKCFKSEVYTNIFDRSWYIYSSGITKDDDVRYYYNVNNVNGDEFYPYSCNHDNIIDIGIASYNISFRRYSNPGMVCDTLKSSKNEIINKIINAPISEIVKYKDFELLSKEILGKSIINNNTIIFKIPHDKRSEFLRSLKCLFDSWIYVLFRIFMGDEYNDNIIFPLFFDMVFLARRDIIEISKYDNIKKIRGSLVEKFRELSICGKFKNGMGFNVFINDLYLDRFYDSRYSNINSRLIAIGNIKDDIINNMSGLMQFIMTLLIYDLPYDRIQDREIKMQENLISQFNALKIDNGIYDDYFSTDEIPDFTEADISFNGMRSFRRNLKIIETIINSNNLRFNMDKYCLKYFNIKINSLNGYVDHIYDLLSFDYSLNYSTYEKDINDHAKIIISKVCDIVHEEFSESFMIDLYTIKILVESFNERLSKYNTINNNADRKSLFEKIFGSK